jgi:hypothetical protein
MFLECTENSRSTTYRWANIQRMDLVEIPGKRSRMVPILIQPHVLKAVDVLMAHRKDLGKNKFFFASHSANGHLYSCAVLRSMTKRAGLERQDLLTSTSLRKYVATAAQIMNLNNGELEWVCSHLEHDGR